MNNPDTVVSTERVLPFTPQEVFEAFQQPERLAQWWGPKGFTNTFEQFEFKPGGSWVFTMHAPGGASYLNESFFDEVLPNEKIVIRHVCQPHFVLTVALTEHDGGTHLAWLQQFETIEIATKMRKLSTTANVENLDRLEAVLAGDTPG
jgi:uncharacterized protein YndB with AHSA1/START domain